MTEDQIQTLRDMRYVAIKDKTIRAAAALDAALTLAGQTCGNCKHSKQAMGILLCMNDDALGSFANRDWSVDPADGCRLGWEAK